ncbi:hypothetical protein LCGC14_0417730 [marine sediment metagenome]|uniref:Uncharacterized protein n=1 Tax=marine sediment metagenome TaxID=412755 RepID=A0A0F9T9S5_9ZZZZ
MKFKFQEDNHGYGEDMGALLMFTGVILFVLIVTALTIKLRGN